MRLIPNGSKVEVIEVDRARTGGNYIADPSPANVPAVVVRMPGKPAAGGAIVATTTTNGGPAVFFVDTAGNLAETAQGSSGTWTSRELLPGGPAISAPSMSTVPALKVAAKLLPLWSVQTPPQARDLVLGAQTRRRWRQRRL